MGNNPSVRQFKTDMQSLSNDANKNFRQSILAMAEELAGNMRNAAPKDTGALAASIRTVDVTKVPEKISVLVKAGGKTTTKRTASGQAFDYAIATEFGSVKETAEPFFYNTYRRYRNPAREFYKETLEMTIKENNAIRAGRGFSTSIATVSVGREGRPGK